MWVMSSRVTVIKPLPVTKTLRAFVQEGQKCCQQAVVEREITTTQFHEVVDTLQSPGLVKGLHP